VSFVADLRSVVRVRDFRRLYVTRLTSQASDGVFQVALASYVFFSPERQTTAGQAAAAFATLLLPYSIVGPFAGVLLDRWRRRQVLVWCNVARAAMVVVVVSLVVGDQAGPPFYLAALAVLSVNRFFLAALSAALPHVVPDGELIMANSVSTTSGTIVAAMGAGVGYGLRAIVGDNATGTSTVMLSAAALYLCAAALARRMAPDLLGPDLEFDEGPAGLPARAAVGIVAWGLVDGARHVARRPAAARALAAISMHRFVYGMSTISTVLLYRNYFNDPADTGAGLAGFGTVVAASAVGFLAAAVITPEVTRRIRTETWIVVTFCTAALTESYYVAASVTEVSILLGAFVVGLVAQASKICVDTIVQISIDDVFRGRVFSFYDVLFNVTFVSAAAVAALVVPVNGYSRGVYATLSLGYALAAALYGRASRRSATARRLLRGERPAS
jgi:MFS family permease